MEGKAIIKISDLRTREVVNIQDGKKMGPIKDLDLDVEKGKIKALVLPGPNRLMNFFTRKEDIIVPWEQIVKIGRDVILIETLPYGEVRHLE